MIDNIDLVYYLYQMTNFKSNTGAESTELNEDLALKLWKRGVSQVEGRKAVRRILKNNDVMGVTEIVSIGKAAASMALGALGYFGSHIRSLVVTKYEHSLPELQNLNNVQVFEASHPTPDQNSLIAGNAVLNRISDLGEESNLLLLISGGASALVEVLAGDTTLNGLVDINEAMMAEDLAIEQINEVRQTLSKIKAGQLLTNFKGWAVTVIFISDVPNDNTQVIGSGIGSLAPDALPGFDYKTYIAANNAVSRSAVASYANELGLNVIENAECLHGEIRQLASQLGKRLREGEDGVYIWGGEPTVVLPKSPGRGGRNQSLALLLARELKDMQSISVVVGGTDGTDGPTHAAGGVISGNTYSAENGHDDAIDMADAGTALLACDSLLVTGPTGTNVMDLIVAIKQSKTG